MYEDELIFAINERERIRVFLPCKVDDIFRWDWVYAEYSHDNVCAHIIFSDDDFGLLIDVLSVTLKQALAGECILDESLQKDLGYLGSIYSNEFFNTPDGQPLPPDWIGSQYLLWETLVVKTWLYEKEGKIFFEITPAYKWFCRTIRPEEKESYVTFEEFIKNYKPYVITELSRETMRVWLKEVERLHVVTKANHDRYARQENKGSAS